MKAAQIKAYGGPEVIEIIETAVPPITGEQVLVEVAASSLNPFDTKLREGYMKEFIPLDFPATLGGDISGIVKEVGSDVTSFSVGDRVFGQANVVSGASGAFAEFAQTKSEQLGKAPAAISLNEAASLPLVGVSAVQALTEHLNLQPGQRIFIHGAAGGIGLIAIQIAKHIGAIVTASIRELGEEQVQQYGADEIIDTSRTPLASLPKKHYDAVYDLVGSDDFATLFPALRPGGVGVSMVASNYESSAKENGITAMTQSTKVTTERLNQLRKLIDEHVVTPTVSKTFSLDQISEAFKARESGSVKGKVVIVIREEK